LAKSTSDGDFWSFVFCIHQGHQQWWSYIMWGVLTKLQAQLWFSFYGFVMCGWKSLDDVSIKQMAMEIRSLGWDKWHKEGGDRR
jgi:hypothetical protein